MSKEFLVSMAEQYPFGELGEVLTEDTRVLVRKTLKISSEEEREILGSMTHFLKVARHEHLINLEQVVEREDEVVLFYEYAPFRLEKWIVTVDEDLLASLEEQMLSLAESLTRSSISFAFNPHCLGLSKDMAVKYFLQEFNIAFEGQESHFRQLRLEIAQFFRSFAASASGNPETEEPAECPRMESLSTNGSISPLDDLISLTQSTIVKRGEEKAAKSSHIAAKVESSMKKSLQALMRFKRMNSK